ncbi:C4-dicarboxylate TRAP transporter substrate-binding protein [Pleomorphochaeta sp. DL1XJH-081]|uniref:C4-dicarboxylate TRAP transporter substrate-binding protein n=1 Tax=Pleomorphochaeta sp. DL1XJH-081 TaxID=3409690 RepID=UPI003BB4F6BB
MKKLLFALVILTMVLAPVMAGGTNEAASGDDYKLELKMSHVFAPNEQLTKSLQMVIDKIAERTDGAIEIQHYPQGQLATYKDGVEQVARGAQFISVEDPSYLGDYVPDFNALVGPMLYKSFDEYEYMIQTELVKGMLEELEEEHRIKVLALDYIFGFRNMKTNKVITTPADLKGMKIRVPGSQLFIDTLTAMGATATPLAFGETLSAVQQGVVDGLEGTMDAYGSNGSAEVAKNMALTRHFLGTCGVYINADLFESIPAEYQAIIQEEFTAGAKHMIGEITNNYDKTQKMLEEKGNKFNEVDYEAFAATVGPVYENMKGVTPGILAKLQSELANMPK